VGISPPVCDGREAVTRCARSNRSPSIAAALDSGGRDHCISPPSTMFTRPELGSWGPEMKPGVWPSREMRNGCAKMFRCTPIISSAKVFACALYMPITPSNMPRLRSRVTRHGVTARHTFARFGSRCSSTMGRLPVCDHWLPGSPTAIVTIT
jgi:hypothetical protein